MTFEKLLTQVFIRVLNLSLMGAFVILAVLAVRLVLRRAPRRYSLWLWAVVFFRLACPITLQSALALLPVSMVSPPDLTVLFYFSFPGKSIFLPGLFLLRRSVRGKNGRDLCIFPLLAIRSLDIL